MAVETQAKGRRRYQSSGVMVAAAIRDIFEPAPPGTTNQHTSLGPLFSFSSPRPRPRPLLASHIFSSPRPRPRPLLASHIFSSPRPRPRSLLASHIFSSPLPLLVNPGTPNQHTGVNAYDLESREVTHRGRSERAGSAFCDRTRRRAAVTRRVTRRPKAAAATAWPTNETQRKLRSQRRRNAAKGGGKKSGVVLTLPTHLPQSEGLKRWINRGVFKSGCYVKLLLTLGRAGPTIASSPTGQGRTALGTAQKPAP